MSVLNFLQRHMKGVTSRATTESALDIKEIGVFEGADKPEAIYKRSDSSGYIHFPGLEWLKAFAATNAGAKEIGVYNDSFDHIAGNTDAQTVFKSIDDKFISSDAAIAALTTQGTFNVSWDALTFDSGPDSAECIWSRNGNVVTLSLPTIQPDYFVSGYGSTTFSFTTNLPAALLPASGSEHYGVCVFDSFDGKITVHWTLGDTGVLTFERVITDDGSPDGSGFFTDLTYLLIYDWTQMHYTLIE